MQNVFLKPSVVDGQVLIVPDPETHRPLKAEGEWKLESTYWTRRIRDKDVLKSEPPPEAKPADSTAAAGTPITPDASEIVAADAAPAPRAGKTKN
jgi:hypothetical protein